MDIQVQELIDKIKKDGIETASQEAARIKTDAEAEASRIIEAAKKEADDIVALGKQDAERLEKAGIAALEQASRNLILSFKDEIQVLLNKIIGSRINENFNDEVLRAALPQLLKSWAEKGNNDLAVILPEGELSRIQAYFTQNLTDEFFRGVELKSNRKLSYGFHISNREGSVYYDFSAEAVASLLGAYLNPKLAEIMKNSASKG